MFKAHTVKAVRLFAALAFSMAILLAVPFAAVLGYHVTICPSEVVGWSAFMFLVFPLVFPFIGVLAALVLIGLVTYMLAGSARYLSTSKTTLAMIALAFLLGLAASQFTDSGSSSCSLSVVR